ncbi:MAG: helix-turn-helix domain-containing protein [Actinomycetota bacterium]|nr:helix-turn-helix domain-containing protein [Actinomycetota bacterium]
MAAAPISVRSHVHHQGGWTMARRPVHPGLGEFLARPPVGFAEHGSAPSSWVDVPAPVVSVIISCAEPFGGFPRAFVVGLADTWSLVELGEPSTSIDLKLTPLGAYRLLGAPLHELGGRTVELTELAGERGRLLVESLSDAEGWAQRFDLVDAFCLALASDSSRPAPEVAWAWSRLARARGRLRIGELAAEVGWSHRHLVSRFREQVGLAPKTAARVLRFRHLLARLERPDSGLAELAYECGYADQAHLNRDFRSFAGTTPTRFAESRPAIAKLGW